MAEGKGNGKKVEGDYHEPEYIQIVVSDPQRKGEFISYKITTSTTFPEYSSREFSVRRRYKEFAWLRDHLKQKLAEKPKAIKFGELYPLPGDTISSLLGKGRFEPEFIEDRRVKLEQFLNSVANHNYFRFIPALHKFLQEQDSSFGTAGSDSPAL
eukprot:Phypoly_transcript_19372.p1 GENE.Phypoly_transcript_19372~~Phypoly_transcript_19372.p1  ORF type:complete len:155 (+),score=29.19 Phypoly_transcript_19372:54-518(+)